MKTFMKWHKKHIEDYGCYMSDDAKSFYRAFKNYIKRNIPEAELIGFKPNHYDFSGFVKVDNRYVYISHSIDRYRCYVDFNESGCINGCLFRTAENENDYHGGSNHFTSIYHLCDDVKELLAKGI